MLLKNFRGFIPLLGSVSYTNNRDFCMGFITTSNANPTEGIDPPDYKSSMVTVSEAIYNNTSFTSTTNNCYFAVIFGDGNVPPTIDDYKLSGQFLDNTKLALNQTTYPSLGIDSITFPVTMRNITSDVITIKEIGLALEPRGTNSSQGYLILLTRDVLSEPVILEPQGIKNFEISIDTLSFIRQQIK